MTHKNLKQLSKFLGIFTALAFTAGIANAQLKTGDIAQNSANGAPQVLNGTVRVIDNKGTIKYLQATNGITTLTNTTANVTTTTWQLGGTLTNDTYIDATGKVFGLDGLKLITDATTASTNAADGSSHGGTGTGWTVLIRDEATGAFEKIQLSDLLQVKAGDQIFTAGAGTTTYTTTFAVTLPTDVNKVSVYRNGAKLLVTTDYTVAGAVVTLIPNATAPNDWSVLAGDVIEVQWVR